MIKDIPSLFRVKKEPNYAAIKDIRNLFRLEKETKAIKVRILKDIKNIFEHEKQEIFYKTVRSVIFGVTFILNTKVTKNNIDPTDWIKNKNATINPINKRDEKCFQNPVTVPLNHEEIKKYLQRIKTN